MPVIPALGRQRISEFEDNQSYYAEKSCLEKSNIASLPPPLCVREFPIYCLLTSALSTLVISRLAGVCLQLGDCDHRR